MQAVSNENMMDSGLTDSPVIATVYSSRWIESSASGILTVIVFMFAFRLGVLAPYCIAIWMMTGFQRELSLFLPLTSHQHPSPGLSAGLRVSGGLGSKSCLETILRGYTVVHKELTKTKQMGILQLKQLLKGVPNAYAIPE